MTTSKYINEKNILMKIEQATAANVRIFSELRKALHCLLSPHVYSGNISLLVKKATNIFVNFFTPTLYLCKKVTLNLYPDILQKYRTQQAVEAVKWICS